MTAPTLPAMLARAAVLIENAGLDPAIDLYVTTSRYPDIGMVGVQVSHLTPVALRRPAVDTLANLLDLPDARLDDPDDPTSHYRADGTIQGVNWCVYALVDQAADAKDGAA